jgi:23S rRNA (cytosine1962-C5)-methyltransferase
MVDLILKSGREKSLIRHHPWIFSGSVAKITGSPKSGETINILSNKGQFLAKAAYSPYSQIAARVWTWDENQEVDGSLFYEKINTAIEMRNKFVIKDSFSAIRLLYGESDGIPGVILDQYDDVNVIQFLTTGAELWRDVIVDIIKTETNSRAIFERSDSDVRQLEGLNPRVGLLWGNLSEKELVINEYGLNYFVDIISGHKTGFYIDQRDNRRRMRNLSRDCKILDCFSYTGGFAINALAGGASSVSLVDSSEQALQIANKNIKLNNFESTNVNFIKQDVFTCLRGIRDRGESFDLIVLDPPKFAPTRSQADRAARGYKDINLLALKILKTGGFLVTFSCSGGISEDLFQKIVAGAALDAGINALIVERLHQGFDHPVALNFPESAYLKGFIIKKIE